MFSLRYDFSRYICLGRFLNKGDVDLAGLLLSEQVMCHPYIIGEIALGSLKARQTVLSLLQELPSVVVSEHAEILSLIEKIGAFSRGIGYVDICLIASAMLTPGVRIWTRDKKLHAVCEELGLAK